MLMQYGRIIPYAPWQLKEYEKNDPTYDLQLIVVIFTYHYLYGEHCQIYTDHKSIKYLFTHKELNFRQRRGLERLKAYDVSIYNYPDKANIVVNALSKKLVQSSRILITLQLPLFEEMRWLGLEVVPLKNFRKTDVYSLATYSGG